MTYQRLADAGNNVDEAVQEAVDFAGAVGKPPGRIRAP